MVPPTAPPKQRNAPGRGWWWNRGRATARLARRAWRRQARLVEVPVSYRSRRAGRSKVSGTVRGTILAGYAILGAVFRYTSWNPG